MDLLSVVPSCTASWRLLLSKLRCTNAAARFLHIISQRRYVVYPPEGPRPPPAEQVFDEAQAQRQARARGELPPRSVGRIRDQNDKDVN